MKRLSLSKVRRLLRLLSKLPKKTQEKLTTAFIAVCIAICVGCVISSAAPEIANTDVLDGTIGDTVSDIKNIGETIENTGADKELQNVFSQIANEITKDESEETKNERTDVQKQENDEWLACTAVRVVDGDTYVVNLNEDEIKVRLIGVDTPESVAPASYSKENTEEGKAVSEIVKDKIRKGDILYLEYDVSPTDRYGRTLAYLYFEDGTMIQEWLLRNGYANIATYPPNVKYADQFKELAHKAAENKVGLWNGFFEE